MRVSEPQIYYYVAPQSYTPGRHTLPIFEARPGTHVILCTEFLEGDEVVRLRHCVKFGLGEDLIVADEHNTQPTVHQYLLYSTPIAAPIPAGVTLLWLVNETGRNQAAAVYALAPSPTS